MTNHQDEFVFKVAGVAGVMTWAEIDVELKAKFQNELDRIERRLCEVIDTKPIRRGLPGQSLGKMPLHDVLLKFK
jgi:hypothetical protein